MQRTCSGFARDDNMYRWFGVGISKFGAAHAPIAMHGNNGPSWPEITSPLARRVLLCLYRRKDCISDPESKDHYGAFFSHAEACYRDWLRQRLRQSSLAAQLATGPEAIPDITEERSGWLMHLLRQLRPRTLEQQLGYLVVNLDWILDPSAQPDWRAQVNWIRIIAVCAVMGIVTAQMYVLNPWITPVITSIAGVAVVIGLVGALSLDRRGCSLASKRCIHATELYWYLLTAFSDPADGEIA